MARARAANFEEKQLHILVNAAAVFAELGMEKASMSQIAARSKVSKALLYHYYPSKSALIFDIIRSHLEELDQALQAVADESHNDLPELRLRKLVRQILECYRDADDKHIVQLNCRGLLAEEETNEINELERRIVMRIADALHDINPEINKKRPLLKPVTMSLFGMLNWVYMWFKPNGPITREEYADVATTLVLEGLKNIK